MGEGMSGAVPDLPHGCGSWVVVRKSDGSPILETFSRRVVRAINREAYDVVSAAAWLASLNQPHRGATHGRHARVPFDRLPARR